MKETKQMMSLWKQSVQWDKMTGKQKLIAVWFSLSMIVLGMSGGEMLPTILALVNLIAAAYCCVKYVPMEEE